VENLHVLEAFQEFFRGTFECYFVALETGYGLNKQQVVWTLQKIKN
jgi:hypothetical protein